ncbi:MAG: hypothetical protein KAT52_03435 [Desulfobacterales bacterium]|nr:hypothetical protein [Desulfobacterales bacterium]
MPKPKLKAETRIKVCLLLKLLEKESHSNIAKLLNQHVKVSYSNLLAGKYV